MATQEITPLAPDSPEGRRVATELSLVLAEAEREIEESRRKSGTKRKDKAA